MKLPSIGMGVQRRGGAERVSGSQGMAPSFWCEQLCFLKKQDCYFYCTYQGGGSVCYNTCDVQHAQCLTTCP